MGNQFSLAQSLIAGMGQQQQPPQQAPQGGLAQAGIPQMSKQGTDMALAAENREDVIEPGLNIASQIGFAQYNKDLMNRLQQTLPSQDAMRRAQSARGLLMDNAMETLAPKEYSGMDTMAAGITSYNKPIMQGDLGSALAGMGQGTMKARDQFEAAEQQKALGAYGIVDKEMDQQQKIISDSIAKSNKLTGMSVPGIVTRQLPDGTVIVLDKLSGNEIRRVGPNESKQFASFFETFMRVGAEKGEYTDMQHLKDWATNQALQALGQSQSAVSTKPKVPTTPPPEAPPQAPAVNPTPPATRPDFPRVTNTQQSGRDIEAYEVLKAEIAAASKAGNRADVESLQKQMQQWFPNGKPEASNRVFPTTTLGTPAPVMGKKDVQLEKEKEGYGAGVGKHMADTSVDVQKTGAAASSVLGDLNVLEQLYTEHGDKVPEGQLAPIIANIKSGAKTLGVDVQGSGMSDVINALATKQALKARTADGENLLPGAMSNYEDQLLQKTTPVLALTQEGRLVLIQIMKAQLEMKVKLAEGAREYIKANKRLDEGWFNKAAEVAKGNAFLNPERISALEEYGRRLANRKGAK